MESSALLLVWLFLWSGASVADVPLLAGQDMHLRSPEMTIYAEPDAPWDHVMGFSGGVNVTIGDNQLSGKEGFIWLKVQGGELRSPSERYYQAYLYLEGSVSIQQGPRSKTTALKQSLVDGADSLVTQFLVTGDVFAVSDKRTEAAFALLRSEPVYQRGIAALSPLAFGPEIPKGAQVPQVPHIGSLPAGIAGAAEAVDKASPGTSESPVLSYPVHLASVWEPTSKIEKTTLADGQEVIIASGRFYIWQKQSEDRMIEFLADNVVLYLESQQFELAVEKKGSELGSGQIRTVYLSGNIVYTESERTVRADEIYYDFRNHRALIVNASLRTYDEKRGLPIYLRAEKLGRVSNNLFEGENIQLTSSEFYLPQVSLTASKMVLLTEEQSVEQRDAAATQYDGRLYDVRGKFGDTTFFKWPMVRTNFARPDIPLSRIRVGSDSEYGTFVETRWKLARLLGLKDPEGVDSRFALDYYSDRGYGTGVDAEYETDNAYGSMIGYVMSDRGKDDLGRSDYDEDGNLRRNVEPDQDIRGRFSFRHRQYLPDDWQLTVETSYISDRNFLEWMYRDEFYTDKSQETLVYLKKVWDNQGFSILSKVRINDFETMTEELPTIEYHRTGQSFWDHRLTWYSDTQLSRLRERYDEDMANPGKGGFYSFATTRNEVDLPLTLGTFKLVPFAAGTYGFEDRNGYHVDLSGRETDREDNVLLGETGLRGSTMFWKADPTVRSQFWDVRGLRHSITPYFEAATYHPSDSAIDNRDYFHAGVTQIWQTHRGREDKVYSVDWMRLDINGTWLSDDADSSIGPAKTYGPSWFVYNDPSIPLLRRRDYQYYGMARDSVNADYEWRISDTYTLLSDANYDIDSGQIQQLDVGVNRYVFPDISYYLGSRYLRPLLLDIPEEGISEQGSHSVVGAVTWQLNSRYTVTFSQEYNFDFGKNVSSDLTVIRRYHRMFYGVSFSIDESLKRNSVMFSVWPQGVKELAVGSRRYASLTGGITEE